MKHYYTYFYALTRIILGFIFLWAFFDKLFGLGYATPADKSWLHGVSPTAGFLTNAVHGPFKDVFHLLAGNQFIDWLFMLGLLGIGMALISGLFVHTASVAGIIMLLLMWLSLLPPANNPIFDEHIVYIAILLETITSGREYMFGKWLHEKKLVLML